MLPLRGLRVIELCHAVAGPCCTALLADMGADVIKVEPITGEYSRYVQNGSVFLNLNCNKRGIALDLKTDRGRELVLKLTAKSDVLVESFTPGTLDKLGLSYETVSKLNPGIIYCSVSGFGHSGPYKKRHAVDPLVQAMSGMLSTTGEPGQPPVRIGPPTIDFGTGMFGAYNIVLALLNRQKSGQGQRIDIALLDTAAYYMGNFIADYSISGQIPAPLGSGSSLFVPYQVFSAKDRFIFIGVFEDNMWITFCQLLGAKDLAEDPRYATNEDRCRNREELIKRLEQVVCQFSSDELMAKLTTIDVLCGPVLDVSEMINDPQVKDRKLVVDVEYPYTRTLKIARIPGGFSEKVSRIRQRPPLLGEHTSQVMKGLGYSETEIESFINDSIVFQYPIS
ncbi:MAG: CoA transferase [Chloroflexi bacterium]|nr:CoA transferase [Chloroflexota bacterium]